MRKIKKVLSSQARSPRIPDDKMMLTFTDFKAIADQLDAIAVKEGTDRSALLRRGARQVIFLSTVPANGNTPQEPQQ